MTNAISLHAIDRATAHALNPLISPTGTVETLDTIKQITIELACFTSPNVDKALQVLLTVSAAMGYEIEAIKQGAR